MNNLICKGCKYFVKYYGKKDKQGKRIVSNYWCVAKNGFIRNYPKYCKFKTDKE